MLCCKRKVRGKKQTNRTDRLSRKLCQTGIGLFVSYCCFLMSELPQNITKNLVFLFCFVFSSNYFERVWLMKRKIYVSFKIKQNHMIGPVTTPSIDRICNDFFHTRLQLKYKASTTVSLSDYRHTKISIVRLKLS